MKNYSFIFLFLILPLISNAQENDTIRAQIDYDLGEEFLLLSLSDSSIFHFKKARIQYASMNNWRRYVHCENKLSENFSAIFELDSALASAQHALDMCEKHLPDNDIELAAAYNNIGNVHYLTGKHEEALTNYQTAIKITDAQDRDHHTYSAPSNLGIGNVYYGKSQYHEAIRYFKKALEANIQELGDDHPYVANSYLSLGNLYRNKGSYRLATDYYDKALIINKKAFGEKHPNVAANYVGIADIYKNKGAYKLALEYYDRAKLIYNGFLHENNPKYGAIYLGYADVFKNQGRYEESLKWYKTALELFTKTIGEGHQDGIRCYLGMGNVFIYQERFMEALHYYNKVLEMNFDLVGENHANTAGAYNNLASIYYFSGSFDYAIKFFQRALRIDKTLHGEDHPNVANAYYNIGMVYSEKGVYEQALDYGQNALTSSIIDFRNSNVYVNPVLLNYYDSNDLLWYLKFKAETLEKGFQEKGNLRGLDIALHSFTLCDSLVEKIRQSYIDENDKIALGKIANKIYTSAVNASYNIYTRAPENIGEDNPYHLRFNKKDYLKRFFFFSEKNKGAVLSAALAESKAKAFGGIPDSLLTRETQLKKDIAEYTQELAANPDSVMKIYYQDLLFKANREYEDLIFYFENNFPKYYQLKYDVKIVTVPEVQSMLDSSTLVISYFVTEDHIYVLTLDQNDINVTRVAKHDKYEVYIKALRQGILMRFDDLYGGAARELYKQLFPMKISENIKKLIVIPDGTMATIPFETLFTEDIDEDLLYDEEHAEYPFLLKKYEVSYAFSANLLYNTFHEKFGLKGEIKADHDFIAYAPIFDETNAPGVAMKTQKVLKEIEGMSSVQGDTSATTRGQLLQGGKVVPLPGTEVETKELFAKFNERHLKGSLYSHLQANEHFIKEGGLNNSKYLHIATHGFVDEEKPELSGILLAQDSLGGEDGILYSGEIYNILLNADLVTLSACETGLGKISKGEGVIGLTRAILYAGSKNLIVSLWKVSDSSTKDLMLHFYHDFLETGLPGPEGIVPYSASLRNAKLKMIESEKYSHPYYWAPFFLIGK